MLDMVYFFIITRLPTTTARIKHVVVSANQYIAAYKKLPFCCLLSNEMQEL